MKLFVFYLSLLLILLTINCSDRQEQSAKNAREKVAPVSVSDIRLLNEQQLQELVIHRNGKGLFLNIWATWCLPCREEFPDLVKLAQTFSDKNVEFVALSVDYPDEIETKILPFLQKNPLNFSVYVQDFSDKEQAINFLNEQWSGALPATFIYDTSGKQQQFLLGQHSYEDFYKVMKPLFD